MAIRVDTPKDHPDVTKISKENMKGKLKRSDRKNQDKADKDAKRFVDSVQTIMAKKRSGTEGSFRSGGRVCKLATKGKGKAYGKNS